MEWALILIIIGAVISLLLFFNLVKPLTSFFKYVQKVTSVLKPTTISLLEHVTQVIETTGFVVSEVAPLVGKLQEAKYQAINDTVSSVGNLLTTTLPVLSSVTSSINGSITQNFNVLTNVTQEVVPIVIDANKAWSQAFQGVTHATGDALILLANSAGKLQEGMQATGTIISAVSGSINSFNNALIQVLPVTGDAIANGVAVTGQIIGGTATTISSGVDIIAAPFKEIIGILNNTTGLLDDKLLGPLRDKLIGPLKDELVGLLNLGKIEEVAAKLQDFQATFSSLTSELAPVVNQVNKLTEVVEPLANQIGNIQGVIGPLTDISSKISSIVTDLSDVKAVVSYLEGIISNLGSSIPNFRGFLAGVLQGNPDMRKLLAGSSNLIVQSAFDVLSSPDPEAIITDGRKAVDAMGTAFRNGSKVIENIGERGYAFVVDGSKFLVSGVNAAGGALYDAGGKLKDCLNDGGLAISLGLVNVADNAIDVIGKSGGYFIDGVNQGLGWAETTGGAIGSAITNVASTVGDVAEDVVCVGGVLC